MNKQFVVAVTSIAMIASSCVSTPKSSRYVASVENNEAIEKIAIQGTPMQSMKDAVGGKYDFRNKPWNPRLFSNADVEKISSASDLKFSKAQILTDNDAAFQQKLSVIKNAKKELRLVYFIYSDDSSSSVLNSALLAKAKEGVEITLLVDLITNYKNLDLFITLNEESKGKIKPYFYNFPSGQMIEDANYMTLPCPKAKQGDATCRQYKDSVMAQYQSKSAPTSFAKLFLTGIYGKSAAAMKVALGMGAQINPADYKSQGDSSEEDKQAMLDLAKITLGALKGNIIDKLKLSIAMAMYGEKITPVLNELNGRFPIGLEKGNSSSAAMWDHFSDYTHHKLVLGDNLEMVNGGRNVEDSYHVKTRIAREDGASAKYIFMDTDFYGKADLNKNPKGLKDVAAAFDSIVHSTMVKDLKTVRDTLAFEFVANTGVGKDGIGSAQRSIGYCMQEAQKGNAEAASDLGGCILSNVSNTQLGYVAPQQRRAAVLAKMKVGYDAYLAHNQNIKSEFQPLSANDLKTASFHYLENLSTDRANNQMRIKGSNLGSESDNSKNIQAAWFRSLENTCKVSRDAKDANGNNVYTDVKPMQVIFHTAYFLMPSGMIHRIAQMLNNDFGDCSRVKITFITNSPFTTDLAPINVLARYQLGALFNHYNGLVEYKKMFESPVELINSGDGQRYVPSTSSKAITFKYKQFWPHMEYYEYTPAAGEDLAALTSKPDSLHTKTSLIGNDLIVGSANADVRSYYMDTNNAMMIRNAYEMNQSYVNMVENLKTSGKIVNKISNFTGKSFETLRAENNAFLVAGAQRWKQEQRLTPEYTKTILDHLDDAGKMIYETTNDLLMYRGVLDQANESENRGNTWSEVQKLNNKANAMDNMFKVF